MTKRELLKEYKALLSDKGMLGVDGVRGGATKETIQNAIDCLRCPDVTMTDYFTIIKLKYPNIHKTISKTGYMTHSHNRLYVYNTARALLEI